jgi:cysteinyl-tRNA synthetase
MMGGAKMSKSLGNVARYQEYQQIFGLDGLRYFALREMPLGQDANFSDEAILTRFNADLANDLGNLVSRATTMVHRYRDGVIPEAPQERAQQLDRDLEAAVGAAIDAVKANFKAYQVSLALQDAWTLVRHVNKYIVEREPWKLAKDVTNTDVPEPDAVSRRRRASCDRLRLSIRSCPTPLAVSVGCLASPASRGRRCGRVRSRRGQNSETSSLCSRESKRTWRNCVP